MDSPKDDKKKDDRKVIWKKQKSKKKKIASSKECSLQKKKHYELHKHSKLLLPGGGNFKEAVKLPEREDLNEWLAVNSKF